jgi:hypothetical protein
MDTRVLRATQLSRRHRSRISNGNGLLPGIDGRSEIARRYRDVVSAIIADQGGNDRCAEARIQLIRRFAACSVIAEILEAKLARGEVIDPAEHAAVTGTMTRVASRIGIDRVARAIPTMDEFLRMRGHLKDDPLENDDDNGDAG